MKEIVTMNKYAAFLLLALLSLQCSEKFPASLMEMNKPAYLLNHFGPWDSTKTKHFTFYYGTQLSQSNALDQLFSSQESNFDHLVSLMKVHIPDTLQPINYFLFDSQSDKYKKTQVESDAHSLLDYWSVYYRLDNAKGAHEVFHLLSMHFWGVIPNESKYNFVMTEGTAFYADENIFWHYDFLEKAKSILKDPQYKIQNIIADSSGHLNWEQKANVSGGFVKYLVLNYGIDKYAEVWRLLSEGKEDTSFTKVYDRSFDEIENQFYRKMGEQ
jgi:hypothetical protein